MQKTTLPEKEIVLLGAGHTNAHVLRMWRMNPIPNARLTCVSNFDIATYSGMLPGVLAGQYPPERMEIDLVRFCAASGVRLILGEVTGLDIAKQELHFPEHPPLPFEVLSVGIGSVPSTKDVEIYSDTLLPIKPMQTFLSRLEERINRWKGQQPKNPLQIAVVGGGVGGVEISFCLPKRLRILLQDQPFKISLINAQDQLMPGMRKATSKKAQSILLARGVDLHLGKRVTKVDKNYVLINDGTLIPVDLVLWATGATAPDLLSEMQLPTDDRGFLLTQRTLQSIGSPNVFVVGDSGTIQEDPTPKAGVYAVRQGPVLWQNLQRIIAGKSLKKYYPQRSFLKLVNTADGKAIAERFGMTFRGRWCWWLKDAIDSRFMDKYQDYQPMEMKKMLPYLLFGELVRRGYEIFHQLLHRP